MKEFVSNVLIVPKHNYNKSEYVLPTVLARDPA
jgi:hypothetical protein